jgi:hypothetical protein
VWDVWGNRGVHGGPQLMEEVAETRTGLPGRNRGVHCGPQLMEEVAETRTGLPGVHCGPQLMEEVTDTRTGLPRRIMVCLLPQPTSLTFTSRSNGHTTVRGVLRMVTSSVSCSDARARVISRMSCHVSSVKMTDGP